MSSQTFSAGCSTRAASAPPAGAEQAERQKAKAVADLQKLFFQEMAKGKNSNEAAADALRRLRDQSLNAGSMAATPTSEMDREPGATTCHPGRSDCSDPIAEQADASEAEAESTPEPSMPATFVNEFGTHSGMLSNHCHGRLWTPFVQWCLGELDQNR